MCIAVRRKINAVTTKTTTKRIVTKYLCCVSVVVRLAAEADDVNVLCIAL
jgi:hypothetical protein